jgi:hypothetical protein
MDVDEPTSNSQLVEFSDCSQSDGYIIHKKDAEKMAIVSSKYLAISGYINQNMKDKALNHAFYLFWL